MPDLKETVSGTAVRAYLEAILKYSVQLSERILRVQ